ncbi:MAG TPA: hypothetical protein ENJ30_02755 [Desulfobulbaceae bacterium]|nr:hypothetical protein [Desulfobulbaceae bacterium]
MSVMPLLDGFFVSALSAGFFEDPYKAITFGCSAFSGAACIGAVCKMNSSVKRQFAFLTINYGMIAFFVFGLTWLAPMIKGIMPDGMYLLTAVFLILLGCAMSGIQSLKRIEAAIGCGRVLKIFLLLLVVNLVRPGHQWVWHINSDKAVLFNALLSVVAGYLLSCSGIILNRLINTANGFSRSIFSLGQGISLLLMGLALLGYPVDNIYPLAALGIGFVAGFYPCLNMIFVTPGSSGKVIADELSQQNG